MDWSFQAARHEEREQIYRQYLELARQSQAQYEAGERARRQRAASVSNESVTGDCGLSWLGSLVVAFFWFMVFPTVFLAVISLVGCPRIGDEPKKPSAVPGTRTQASPRNRSSHPHSNRQRHRIGSKVAPRSATG